MDNNTPNISRLFDTLPLRFRPDKAQQIKLCVHFDIAGNPHEQYSVQIADGLCSVAKGRIGAPDCWVSTDADTYSNIELGNTNAQTAFMEGKITVSDISVMLAFGKLFGPFKPNYLPLSQTQTTAVLPQIPAQGPLAGIRVLDLSRLLPGPLAAKMLADMGAEVLKIEDPNALDEVRHYPPFVADSRQSAYYLALNAGKKSLTLDLRNDNDRTHFLALVQTADVVLESFRPGVLAKLGLDYAALKPLNPRLVMVSLTGYGQQSPYKTQAGHDLNYMALSGLLSLNRQADGKPVVPNVQIADVAGGAYMAVSACLAALLHREKTGQGDWVDVAMSDGLLPLLSLAMAEYRASGVVPQNGQTALSGALPNYNVYECADGKWVALGALEPKFWARFCQAVARPQWLNCIIPHRAETRQTTAEVAVLFATQPRAYWLAMAAQHDMCLSAVNDLSEVCAEPHFIERGMFCQHTHQEYGTCAHIGLPFRFAQTPLPNGHAAPLAGEHNADIGAVV